MQLKQFIIQEEPGIVSFVIVRYCCAIQAKKLLLIL